MSPERDDVEQLAQPPAAPAVVGHRDDPGERAGVAPGRLERGGRAVPAADGDDRGRLGSPVRLPATAHRSMSRWKTDTAVRRRPSRAGEGLGQRDRAMPPAGAADGDGQVRLALADEGREDAREQVVQLLEEGLATRAGPRT